MQSIDLLRGAAIILMALDHSRDFFHTSGWDPGWQTVDPSTFLTRWITHFCAPTFVFLAGISAGLALGRGRARADLERFLRVRGLWLAFLDMAVVSCVWFFRLGRPLVTDVLWAIGWSMVVLALLVRFPRSVAAATGGVLIAGHNAFDGVHAAPAGVAGMAWRILHEPGMIHLPWGTDWFVGYPLVPWIGVMAVGFAVSSLFDREPLSRRRALLVLGIATTSAFVAIRALNVYGDPAPWAEQSSRLRTVFSFVSCQKYPPSLCFVLMTLGPALLALAAFDRAAVSPRNLLLVFGRAPLFFYVAHLFLLHAAAGALSYSRFGAAAFHVDPDHPPAGFGVPLAAVYLAWTAVVLALYLPCRWFGALKGRRSNAWLSYL